MLPGFETAYIQAVLKPDPYFSVRRPFFRRVGDTESDEDAISGVGRAA